MRGVEAALFLAAIPLLAGVAPLWALTIAAASMAAIAIIESRLHRRTAHT